MTKNDLVEKLNDMRTGAGHGDLIVMTHLFGCIFDKEIIESGTNAREIAEMYSDRYTNIGAPAISDGRKLARFVTVRDAFLRRWR